MFAGRDYGGPRPVGRPRKYLKGAARERKPSELCIDGCGKYRQGRDGRCYRCRRLWHAQIIVNSERAQAEALEQELAAEVANVPSTGQMAERRTIVARGQEYEVVWDGT